jgi:hypothetical protein
VCVLLPFHCSSLLSHSRTYYLVRLHEPSQCDPANPSWIDCLSGQPTASRYLSLSLSLILDSSTLCLLSRLQMDRGKNRASHQSLLMQSRYTHVNNTKSTPVHMGASVHREYPTGSSSYIAQHSAGSKTHRPDTTHWPRYTRTAQMPLNEGMSAQAWGSLPASQSAVLEDARPVSDCVFSFSLFFCWVV